MKRIVQLSSILILALLLVVGCNNNTKKNEISENKIDLSTQEAYEAFLADWGITIPENATLKELKMTNDGNYKLIYSIEPFENMQDSLQTHYENMCDKALLNKGWVKPKEGWDPHGTVYEKDDKYFKFFILISEDYNVYELAFKYGQ